MVAAQVSGIVGIGVNLVGIAGVAARLALRLCTSNGRHRRRVADKIGRVDVAVGVAVEGSLGGGNFRKHVNGRPSGKEQAPTSFSFSSPLPRKPIKPPGIPLAVLLRQLRSLPLPPQTPRFPAPTAIVSAVAAHLPFSSTQHSHHFELALSQ